MAGNVGSFDRSQAFGRSMVTTTSAAQGHEFQMFVAWWSFGKDHHQIKGWDWKVQDRGKEGRTSSDCFLFWEKEGYIQHLVECSFCLFFLRKGGA